MRSLQRGKVRVLIDVVREPECHPGAFSASLKHARGAAELFRAYRESAQLPESKEAFLVLVLNAKHTTLCIDLVSIGSLQSSIVHPREVFRLAVVLAGAAIVVCHNHPSGDSAPSHEDSIVTERLVEAGRLLGIPCLDHLILGDDSFYSFTEGRALMF